MGTGKRRTSGLIVTAVTRNRTSLLHATALQAAVALVFVSPAAAQLAPNAHPTGGTVVGGSATIGQAATVTTVNQASQRAAIDWRSFDVGSNASVQFQQPNASAVVLNRVTGPNPSQIAGRIQANGQVVITNQSGVVFHQGAQVDTAGLVVSAAGITNRNFMAGKMVFDQAPKPGATVSNAGTITIKQAGLAALVAPNVVNSGVISAKMGHVVLAGAETHTIDLYGDGLLSFDVTGQVRQAPRGADGKPVTALVTNTGTVVADGGTVLLTAKAADGIVQNLVHAGGRIQANTADGRTGTVVVAGVGGDVLIDGRVAADGNGPGGTGGTVVANASGAVKIGTAAHISASGTTGGGTIALGTALARGTAATPGATAARVTVASGARIAANARQHGNGGTVTLRATDTVTVNGRIAARGGAQGGNGGAVTLAAPALAIAGTLDTGAPAGNVGSILLDPTDVTIGDSGGTGTVITPAALEAMTGDVTVQADNSIVAASSVTLTGADQSLTLDAGNSIQVNAGVTLDVTGGVTLQAGAGGVNLLGNITARGNEGLALNTTGAVAQDAASTISALLLTGTVGSAALTSRTNVIDQIGAPARNGLTATAGDISIVTSVPLTVVTPRQGNGTSVTDGHTVSLTTDTLTLENEPSAPTISAPGGTISIQPFTAGRPIEVTGGTATANTLSIQASDLSQLAAPTLSLGSSTAGPITLTAGEGGLDFGAAGITTLHLASAGAVTQNGSVAVTNLDGSAASFTLGDVNNFIATIGPLTATGDVFLHTSDTLAVNGAVQGANVTLSSSASTLDNEGTTPSTLASMTLNANVTGGTVTFDTYDGRSEDLSTSGALVQNSGIVTATALSVNAGAAAMTQQNVIGGVSSFTTFDNLSLTTAGAMPLTGTVSSETGTVSLVAGGAITQTADSALQAPALTASAASISLGSANNSVSAIGPLTASGDILFSTSDTLAVNGDVKGANVTLASAGFPGDTTGTFVSMALNANVTGGNVSLSTENSEGITNSGVLMQNSGIVTANFLTVTAGGATMTQPNVVTGGVAGFSTFGDLSFTTAGDMPLTGRVSSETSGITLVAGGAITQTADSAISTFTLSGSAASASLTSQNNFIRTLSNFSTSSGDLAVTTTLDPACDCNGLPFLLDGTISVPTGRTISVVADAVSVDGATSVSAPGGKIAFAPLTAGTDIELVATAEEQTANVLSLTQADLDSLHTGTLQLGSTAAGPILIGKAGDTIGITNSATTLSLLSGGAVTQGGGAVLAVPVLTAAADSVTLDGANQIGTLAAVTTAGAATVDDAQALSVAGPVSAGGAAALSATGGLSLSGAITAPSLTLTAGDAGIVQSAGTIAVAGAVTIDTTGPVSQTGGSLSADTLNGSAGPVALGSTSIANLGPFTTTGAFALTDSRSLTVAGALDPGDVTLNVTGDLAIDSTVTGATVALGVSGDVTEGSGGSVIATTLRGTAGSLTLGQAANGVGTLADFTGTGGVTLVNAQALTVAGPVADGSTIALTSQGPLTVAGSLTAPSVTLTALRSVRPAAAGDITQTGGSIAAVTQLTLTAADAIGQTGGTVSTALLTGSAGGAASLAAAGNAIAGLGPFTAGGDMTLNDGTTALTVAGAVNIGTNTLSLTAGSLTGTAAGGITAGTLTGSTAGATDLTAGTNAIATLGTFGSNGLFALRDGSTVTVTGTVTVAGTAPNLSLASDAIQTATSASLRAVGGTVTLAPATAGITLNLSSQNAITANSVVTADTLQFGNATTGPITIDGAFNLSGVNTLRLVSSGAIGETATGAIVVPNLSGSAGSAVLAGPNAIATLTGFTTTGGFALNNTRALAVADTVTAGSSIQFAVTGDLSLAANLAAPAVTLDASGAIAETAAGSIAATSLAGNAGSATLDGPNTVATLAGFATAGGFTLTDTRALSVADAVTAGASVRLGITGDLALAANVTAPAVTLDASGAVTETAAGSIAATSLAGDAGSAALTGPNAIATLAGFATTGSFALTDTRALSVADAVTGGSSVQFDVAGDLALAANVTAPAVTLDASGAISQNGSRIAATTLSGTAGSAVLGSLSNQVANLGPFQASGPFLLADGRSLTVTGAVDPANVTLSALGDLTINNTVTADTLTLQATGAVTEGSGGSAIANTLRGTANSASLTQANSVGTLAGFTSQNGFTLADQTALTVTGPVTDATAITLSSTGPLTVSGNITAPGVTLTAMASTPRQETPAPGTIAQTAGTIAASDTLTLTAAGAVTQAGGQIAAGTVTGSSGGATALGQAANQIGTLGSYSSVGGFSLTNGQSLAQTGTLTDTASVSLTTPATLTLAGTVNAPVVSLAAPTLIQTGGTLVAGRLNLNTTADTALAGQVGALGTVQSPGSVSLNDSIPLTVSGPVNAGTLALSGSDVTFAGQTNVGTLRLASASATQTGGTLSAGTLTGSTAGALRLNQGSTAIATLADVTAGGALAITDAAPLTVSGTNQAPQIALAANGAITLQAGTIRTNVLTASATGNGGTVVQTGTTAIVPLGNGQATVNLSVQGGSIALQTLSGPNAALTLAMGGGTASGALDAASLLVDDTGGSAALTGTVAGQTGFGAAMVSQITRFDPAYTMNGCAIAAVSCVPITPVVPPPAVVLAPVAPPAPPVTVAAAPAERTVVASAVRPDIVLTDSILSILRTNQFIADLITLDITRNPNDPDFALPNVSDRDY